MPALPRLPHSPLQPHFLRSRATLHARTRDFPLNPWTANALSCRNHSQGAARGAEGGGEGTEAGETIARAYAKILFYKIFKSSA